MPCPRSDVQLISPAAYERSSRSLSAPIEHGITPSAGKRFAITSKPSIHYDALLWMRDFRSRPRRSATTSFVNCTAASWRSSQPESAGLYSTLSRRSARIARDLSQSCEDPETLMDAFGAWLEKRSLDPPVFEAHFRLTRHSSVRRRQRTHGAAFDEPASGSRHGYPPVAVRPEDRRAYLDAPGTPSIAHGGPRNLP